MVSISPAYNQQTRQLFPVSSENSSENTDTRNPLSADARRQQSDTVSISDQGKEMSAENSSGAEKNTVNDSKNSQVEGNPQSQEQAQQDFRVIQQLKKRDTEVRAHEQAHLSAAGRYAAGGASFTYQTGPDGTQYAIGGEVPIDLSNENTPEETIQKMETIKRAALAPADPSSADRQIAAQASAKEIQAMQELQSLQREKNNPHIAVAETSRSDGRYLAGKSNTDSPSSPKSSSVSISLGSIGSTHFMMIKTYQGIASLA
jgi:hypothetical protein